MRYVLKNAEGEIIDASEQYDGRVNSAARIAACRHIHASQDLRARMMPVSEHGLTIAEISEAAYRRNCRRERARYKSEVAVIEPHPSGCWCAECY